MCKETKQECKWCGSKETYKDLKWTQEIQVPSREGTYCRCVAGKTYQAYYCPACKKVTEVEIVQTEPGDCPVCGTDPEAIQKIKTLCSKPFPPASAALAKKVLNLVGKEQE